MRMKPFRIVSYPDGCLFDLIVVGAEIQKTWKKYEDLKKNSSLP